MFDLNRRAIIMLQRERGNDIRLTTAGVVN